MKNLFTGFLGRLFKEKTVPPLAPAQEKPKPFCNDYYMHHWYFQYNPYARAWYAFHRDDRKAYHNGTESRYAIIRGENMNQLLHTLKATKGDKKLLERLTKY